MSQRLKDSFNFRLLDIDDGMLCFCSAHHSFHSAMSPLPAPFSLLHPFSIAETFLICASPLHFFPSTFLGAMFVWDCFFIKLICVRLFCMSFYQRLKELILQLPVTHRDPPFYRCIVHTKCYCRSVRP